MIEVANLTRVFRTYKKQPGFWGGVKGLFHREFEETAAAKDVSFSIKEGEFVGFLGPNGAGKTTTLKMLSGLIYPTSGTARVAGFDPTQARERLPAALRARAGPEEPALVGPARDRVVQAAARDLRDSRRTQFKATLDELVTLLDVGKKLNVMVRELSLGERMKMELIAALLHRPRVLFLDEPTIGLDVVSQKAVRQFLRDYNRRHRVTILLTSHYMADIKELCERVIVIHKGRKSTTARSTGWRPAAARARKSSPSCLRRATAQQRGFPRNLAIAARAARRPAPTTANSRSASRATTWSPCRRKSSAPAPWPTSRSRMCRWRT